MNTKVTAKRNKSADHFALIPSYNSSLLFASPGEEPSEHGIVALRRHPELFAGDGLDPIRKHLLGDIGMRVDVVVA